MVRQLLLPVLYQLQLAEGMLCPTMPLKEMLNNTDTRYQGLDYSTFDSFQLDFVLLLTTL